MNRHHALRLAPPLLAALLLLGLAAPAVDASMPTARSYRVGAPITLDTNLLSASGATAWAIDEYLASATPLPPLGAAFLAAEAKYGVNARFLLAAAMHESGLGTSYIARVKHNLFGYNAYDRDPVRYATAFATYAANIDATAKFIKDSYLSKSGRWWGGQPTLRSMQLYWSSSGTWGVSVSRVANAISLDAFAGKSVAFATPAVVGALHEGDRASAKLTWSGGTIPAGIGFAATWVPVNLDGDVTAAAGASPSGAAPTPVAAARTASARHAVTLAIPVPGQPGDYVLQLELRDTGGGVLPRAQRAAIPSIQVHVWGDRAVSVDVEPSSDGSGADITITNTGRETIPATASSGPSSSQDPEGQAARSTVTVTALSGNTANAAPVLLLSSPLGADLPPGASTTYSIADIAATTGRSTSLLSIGVSVLGDSTWLAPSVPVGIWFSDGAVSSAAPTSGAASTGPIAAPSSIPTPAPTPTTAPVATPDPVTTPPPTFAPTITPAPTASPVGVVGWMPAPAAGPAGPAASTPAPKPVTTTYSEHSGAIVYRGTWGNAPNSGYIGGNVAWSKSAGSTATFTFTGSSVSWVGPKGPTRGVALVLIDGRAVAQVNLWQPSFTARAVVFSRSLGASGRHTLTIKVLASPSHPCVAIDAFVVRS